MHSFQSLLHIAVLWELSEQNEIQRIQSGTTLDLIVRRILEVGFNMYLSSSNVNRAVEQYMDKGGGSKLGQGHSSLGGSMCVCVSVVLYIFDCECAHFSAKYILSVLHYCLRFDTSCCNYHYIFNLSVCCFIHTSMLPSSPLHRIVLTESLMRKASMIVCHCSVLHFTAF